MGKEQSSLRQDNQEYDTCAPGHPTLQTASTCDASHSSLSSSTVSCASTALSTSVSDIGSTSLEQRALYTIDAGSTATAVEQAPMLEEPTERPGVLMTSIFASHALRLKGEDGLRVERLHIGGDAVLCAVVVDGHGGHEAALFVVDHIIEFIIEETHADASGSALSQALELAFQRLHVLLCEDDQHTSGTTATVCLINETRGEVTTGHVGDSAAILCAATTTLLPAIPLTGEHRLADSEDERARVVASGGKLGHATIYGQPAGPLRAFPGGVCCARALGDRDCGPFLSAVPDITVMPFPEGNACVLIASDGVWDAIPRETAIKTALKAKDVRQAAERIVSKALRAKGLRDDITCVCIVSGRNPKEVDSSSSDGQGATQGSSRSAGARRRASQLMSQIMPSALRIRPTTCENHATTSKSPDPSIKGGMLFTSLAAAHPAQFKKLDQLTEETLAAAARAAAAMQGATQSPFSSPDSFSTPGSIPRNLSEDSLSALSQSSSEGDDDSGGSGGYSSSRQVRLLASLTQQPAMQLLPRTLGGEASAERPTSQGVGLLANPSDGMVKLKVSL